MTLPDLIFERCADKNTPCVIQGDYIYTYRELFGRIASISKFLLEPIGKPCRVGILAENGIEFISSYLACMSSGFTVVPINTMTYSSDLEYEANDSEIRLVLCSDRFFGKLGFSSKKLISEIRKSGEYSPTEIGEDSLAALMYTSGSTGKPNAVEITHKNLVSNTESILGYLDMGPSDRVMAVLPFYYCYGASVMHTTLASGGTLVINNRFMFPQKVLDEIAEKKCTIFAGVPSTYKILLNRARLAESDTSSLRYALQAGGRLSPTDLEKLRKAMPNTKIMVMYGQTEATARLSYLPFEYFESKMGSIGKGIPGVELKVVDGSGEGIVPGETGEIIARGDNISPGYLNKPEETKRTFANGWLHTGDMATVDEDGFIYVIGRSKDFVKVAGNRFSTVEVEDLISAMDGVENVAVVGVPDDLLGESLHAFVISNGKLSEEDIITECKRNLPTYKIPQKVSFLKELPLNAFGKVQKFKLAGKDNY